MSSLDTQSETTTVQPLQKSVLSGPGSANIRNIHDIITPHLLAYGFRQDTKWLRGASARFRHANHEVSSFESAFDPRFDTPSLTFVFLVLLST